jgi:hypothetical protein
MSNNPYELPPGGFATNQGGGPVDAAMRAKVTPPAIGLIVVGVLNVLFSLYGVLMSVLFMAGVIDPTAAQREQFQELAAQGEQQAQMAEMFMQFSALTQGPLGLVTNLLAFAVGGLIVFGAMKMKNLESYGLALTSAILAMIPCLSACCIIGLPIGVWALVVLMDSNVKNSFR